MTQRPLRIGGYRPLDGLGDTVEIELAARDLAQHTVVVGMTGSGKTGLMMVLVEEALRAGVPVLMFDVKGDLPNLCLTFPASRPEDFEPWLDPASVEDSADTVSGHAATLARARRAGLEAWGIDEAQLREYRARTAVRVITPGTRAGEMLNVLSSLETPSPLWASDVEAARESLGASISLLLRLVGRDPDPTASRDHVVLSVFAEQRLRDGRSANVEALLADLETPAIEHIGAMTLDAFLPKRDRRALATALNTLLASPTFASWREGIALDVGAWLRPGDDGRTPAVIVSVAHLDDEERSLVMGMLLEEVLTWVRSLQGTSALRALIVFDEVYGYAPPHPANPPAKRPLVSLMKQARAFGVGMVLATQNPMDLDYRALSNAGTWFVGRLQTDADRARVVEGLVGSDGGTEVDARELAATVKLLSPRWFVMRDAARRPSCGLVQSRDTMCWLRGPMVRSELRRVGSGSEERR